MTYDYINALFQLGSAFMIWLNVRQLYIDKRVSGVNWKSFVFYTILGIWNIFFYQHLQQWYSIVAGCIVIIGNITWCGLALYYNKREYTPGCATRFRDI